MRNGEGIKQAAGGTAVRYSLGSRVMKRQLFNSAIFRFLETLINVLVVFLLTPFFIEVLGQEQYGLWILITSSIGWFGFIDMGFSAAIQRQIAISIEKNDIERISALFSCAVILFACFGLLAWFGVFVIGIYPEVIGVDERFRITASTAISVLALKVFYDFLMQAYFGFYSGTLRQDIDAALSAGNTTLRSVLFYVLVPDFYIFGAVAATMLADTVFNTLKVSQAKRLCPGFQFDIALVSKREIFDLFSFSKHVAANVVARTIFERTDPIVIANIMDLQKVALYSVANRLSHHINTMITAFFGFFLPVFSRLLERKSNIEREFSLVVGANCILTLSFLIPLVILGQWFLSLWLGDSFETTGDILTILCFVTLTSTVSRPIMSLLLAAAQHKMLSLVNLTGALFNLCLSIVLGKQFGLVGIAISTLISAFLSGVVLHLWMLRRYMSYGAWSLFIKYVVSNIILLVVDIYVAKSGLLSSLRASGSIFEFVLTAAVIFPMSVIASTILLGDKGVWSFLLSSAERVNQRWSNR